MIGPSPFHRIGLAAACREPISVSAATASAATALASTAATIATTFVASRNQAAAQRGAAARADFDARQELIRGQQQSQQLRENLLRTLSAQRARFAGAGLATDDGTPQGLQDQAREDAERELGIVNANATIRSGQQRSQAKAFRNAAGIAATSGALSAGLSLFDTVDSYAQRMAGTPQAPLPNKKPAPLAP